MCEVWIYTWQCGHEGKDRKIQTLCDLASQVGVWCGNAGAHPNGKPILINGQMEGRCPKY
ncbi:hypothetical protein TWF703_009410 [Orbilia oligospora]|uniref:Uncharacterized protein n=1 Tax=Orbilia oligospora TaxID=2813651 RepID=A0A7C8K0M7_ORBOL|nr:hypothetical protein TWF703_009410 [Orbilia oligospora]